MSIFVKRVDGGSYECIAGAMRMRAMLAADGRAIAQDVETGETVTIHEVGDQLVALDSVTQAAVEALAEDVIVAATR